MNVDNDNVIEKMIEEYNDNFNYTKIEWKKLNNFRSEFMNTFTIDKIV